MFTDHRRVETTVFLESAESLDEELYTYTSDIVDVRRGGVLRIPKVRWEVDEYLNV